MSPAKYQAVLFDLDGTLLDTAPDFTTAINLMLSRHQRPPLSENDIRAIITHGSAGLLGYAFQCSEDDAGFETLREEFLDIYFAHLADKTGLFPGIAELLTALGQRDIPWASSPINRGALPARYSTASPCNRHRSPWFAPTMLSTTSPTPSPCYWPASNWA